MMNVVMSALRKADIRDHLTKGFSARRTRHHRFRATNLRSRRPRGDRAGRTPADYLAAAIRRVSTLLRTTVDVVLVRSIS